MLYFKKGPFFNNAINSHKDHCFLEAFLIFFGAFLISLGAFSVSIGAFLISLGALLVFVEGFFIFLQAFLKLMGVLSSTLSSPMRLILSAHLLNHYR
jgi:hypothetical protein